MTTSPEFEVGWHLYPALAAVALFVAMAGVILGAGFGPAQGFPAESSVVASIGLALIGLDGGIAHESLLAAFEIVDLVLVAALVGAVLFARRDVSGAAATLLADGGDETPEATADSPDDGGDS